MTLTDYFDTDVLDEIETGFQAAFKQEPAPVPELPTPAKTPTTLEEQQKAQGERIAQETVIFELRVTLPSITKPMAPDFDAENPEPLRDDFLTDEGFKIALEEWKEKAKADKKMIRRKKYIINPERLKPLQQCVAKHRDWLRMVSVPTSLLRGGLYMPPLVYVDQVETKQKEFEAEIAGLVDELVEKWEGEIIEEAQELLKGDFNPLDYKSAEKIREACTVKSRYLSFNAPQALQKLNSEIYEREKEKAARQWDEAGQEIRAALREGFAELVNRLATSLQPTADGKPKRLYDTAVTNLTDFLTFFEGRNLTSDTELQKLVEQAKSLTSGVSPDALRKGGDLRARVGAGMKSISESVSKLCVTTGRAIASEGDEL